MRIVIAEPSAIGRKIIAGIVEPDGHQVVCAGDADIALDFIRSGAEFEVLITAIEFANMSGFELCWEAKLAVAENRPVYVIVLSSSRDEAKLVEALDCGADEFVTKPPRPSELLARLRAAGRLINAQRELIHLASYDALTGLRNRRAFFSDLEKLVEAGGPFSLIMFDLDHFKRINDTHGHDAGDEVLREFARRAAAIDKMTARLGGEEFGLLVRAPISEAGFIAERIRLATANAPFETSAGPLDVTTSIGVANGAPGMSGEQVVKEADIALYASKSAGRNRVTLSRGTLEHGIAEIRIDSVRRTG
ncbi:MAG: diguanylate cyclase [Hyphomicrobiales bacterium]|uniref:diguanylate cyclase domain-containing protein n=1 Tax=Rhabdaerophilum calidifontis TaxID=2604328 RepID=UPI00123A08BF|nr:diguanylate cyclase [Rhabdaerophilum calidifontis]MCA1952623.1 diguanylate cyclase [Hyphomicrobiales bacterium]MCA2000084.1 diguanylate cyclase [Hyphomicrobiales bacterium]